MVETLQELSIWFETSQGVQNMIEVIGMVLSSSIVGALVLILRSKSNKTAIAEGVTNATVKESQELKAQIQEIKDSLNTALDMIAIMGNMFNLAFANSKIDVKVKEALSEDWNKMKVIGKAVIDYKPQIEEIMEDGKAIFEEIKENVNEAFDELKDLKTSAMARLRAELDKENA